MTGIPQGAEPAGRSLMAEGFLVAAPTITEVEIELSVTRIAIMGDRTPTGQQVSYGNPVVVLEALEKLQARLDRKSGGVAQLRVGFR